MRISTRNFLLSIFLVFSTKAYTQDSTQSQSWRNVYVPKTLLRLGVGYQGSFFAEAGVMRRKFSGEDLVILGSTAYGSIEWTPNLGKNPSSVYGLKLGGELTVQAIGIGVETKYQTDFQNNDVVITPRIGIGDGNFTGLTRSYIYLWYGYNLSLNHRPFEALNKHQFSLIVTPFVLSYIFNRKNYTKKLYK